MQLQLIPLFLFPKEAPSFSVGSMSQFQYLLQLASSFGLLIKIKQLLLKKILKKIDL